MQKPRGQVADIVGLVGCECARASPIWLLGLNKGPLPRVYGAVLQLGNTGKIMSMGACVYFYTYVNTEIVKDAQK